MLHFHQTQDIRHGLDSHIIVLFENSGSDEKNVHFLGLHTNSSIHHIRAKFSAAIRKLHPQITIYHMAWGMPFLVDLDGAERRLLVQHGQIPNMEQSLSLRAPWLDGVVCIGNTVQNDVTRFCPTISIDRLPIIPYPITSEWEVKTRAATRNRPLVIGFCGRISFEQKRIDRLPKLSEALSASGVDFRLEIIGDGPQRDFLKEKLGQHANVRIHGRLSGQNYWQTLGNLDFILFTSDYEGIPLALLEAMKLGVIPLYPKINSGADDYIQRVSPSLLYPPDDFHSLAQLLRKLWSNPVEIETLRARSRAELMPHTSNNYMEKFSQFVRETHQAPRISHNIPAWRPPLLDHLPQTVVAKIGYVRRGLKRLFKKPSTV